ncbi:MAG: hypothetical protein R6W70_10840 [bacterium]
MGFKMLIFVFVFVVSFVSELDARRFVFEEIKIEGRIQKPEAMYFLQRARFRYEMLNLEMSFIGNIKEAIFKKDAF